MVHKAINSHNTETIVNFDGVKLVCVIPSITLDWDHTGIQCYTMHSII